MPTEPTKDLICRSFGVTARSGSIDLNARTIDFICSTDTIDAYGDSVEQKWDLKRFNANPVLLFAHDSRDLPIGTCERMRVAPHPTTGRDCLQCTGRLVSEKANPRAEQVLMLFNEGALNAVSVGFLPHTIRFEKRDDKEVCVLSDNELFELSVTPIPANPDALAKHVERARTNAPRAPETNEMDQKDVDALVAKTVAEKLAEQKTAHDAALAAKDAEVEAAEAKTAELEAKAAVDAGEVERAKAEKDATLDRAIGLEVDALVGKKILPAEKASFVALAKKDRPLFDQMIEARPTLKLLDGKALPDEPGEQTNGVANEANDHGGDLVKAIAARQSELLKGG